MYQPARLPSLDGWRAVAIALVVLGHFEASRGFPPSSWWHQVFQSNLGVRIFFVISGLLITYLLLLEAERRGRPSLRSFYARRVLRIFPVYFLYLAVVLGLAGAGLYVDTPGAWIGSLTFTRNFIGQNQSLTGHYWSLAVEEQFYLVWPVTLVAFGLWQRRRLAAALLLIPVVLCPLIRADAITDHVSSPLIHRALNFYSIARYADSLAVGCLGAFAYLKYRARIRSAPPWTSGAALAVLVLAAAADGRAGAFEPVIPLVEAIAVLFAIGLTVEQRSGLLYQALNAPVVVWLGILSYSLYVWQELFIAWSAGPKLSALPVYDWRVWWIGALVCACGSYYLVERPILRIRDRYRRVNLPRAGAL
ncbi:MAG TPA: acyltransferase [Vicinamibacterales bacterium]|nr:acyltransferase [Vicinamibacterales bacterium]